MLDGNRSREYLKDITKDGDDNEHEHKYENSYNLTNSQGRSSKFCMEVNLNNTKRIYYIIPYHFIPFYTKQYHTLPNTKLVNLT